MSYPTKGKRSSESTSKSGKGKRSRKQEKGGNASGADDGALTSSLSAMRLSGSSGMPLASPPAQDGAALSRSPSLVAA